MELEYFSFSIFLTSLLFVFMVLKLKNGKTANLPPGPWKLPIIGNLQQLVCSIPHQKLRDLAKKYGPLMHLQLGELSTVIVSSQEFATEVLKTHDLIFASRPYVLAMHILFYNSSSVAFSPYGDYWRRAKKIVSLELLSTKQVQSFRSVREEEASNFVSRVASKAGSPINFTSEVHSTFNAIITRAAFGTSYKDDQNCRSVIVETLELMSGFSIADMFPSIEMLQWITGIRSRLEKLHTKIDTVLENIINEHKQSKATSESACNSEENKDLLDCLLNIQEDGGEFQLTTDNVKAIIWDLFLGGTDTPGTTINWAMAELMKNPTSMKKVQAEVREVYDRMGKIDEMGISEMKYMKAVIKEALRLHPPGPLLGARECRERCEIQGFEIPAKTKVIVNVWAIARDPEYWDEPESFIPERFIDSSIDYRGSNFGYLPFGAGRRMCPGISFGMAQVELLLAMLLYHFDWKLPHEKKPEDLNMNEAFGITVRREGDLNLIPIPYRPPAAA